MRLTAKERLKRTAYHEAGHGVVAYLVRRSFRYVTIEKQEDSLGHVHFQKFREGFQPDVDIGPKIERTLEKEIMTGLGGLAAEKILTGRKRWTPSRSDIRQAMNCALQLHGDPETADKYIDYLLARTEKLLKFPVNWAAVQALAEKLLEHHWIGYRKTREIIKNAMRGTLPDHVKESMTRLEAAFKKTKQKGGRKWQRS